MAFASTQEVSFILRQLMPGATPPSDFTSTSNPSLTEVKLWLDLSSAEVEFTFGSVGFKVPLMHSGGTALTTRENNFLKLLNILGASSYVVDSMKPTVTAGGRSTVNSLRDRYNQTLKLIRDTLGYGMRLDAYPGTEASNSLADIRGPMSDFRENKHDSRDYLMLHDFTQVTDMANLQEADIRLWNISGLITWSKLNGLVA